MRFFSKTGFAKLNIGECQGITYNFLRAIDIDGVACHLDLGKRPTLLRKRRQRTQVNKPHPSSDAPPANKGKEEVILIQEQSISSKQQLRRETTKSAHGNQFTSVKRNRHPLNPQSEDSYTTAKHRRQKLIQTDYSSDENNQSKRGEKTKEYQQTQEKIGTNEDIDRSTQSAFSEMPENAQEKNS
ncbi:uncharacterized protein VTP21DRAFT_4164 [Calcarisporiella thermophila]|uniref:uncharacterized protein n=1 Tax=Calcarisporiella thermophila TaxID=911321 RepID=UPI00374277B4